MGKTARQANIELLRIAAMFMVVVMHYLTVTIEPVPGSGVHGSDVGYAVTESLCIVAVNVYVLISGYFLSPVSFSLRRVGRVLAQTLFYTILLPLVLVVCGILPFSEVFGVYHIWNSIFPVQSGHYWFVTAYVVLLLFTPFLNAAVQRLDKKAFMQALLALLAFFCFGKTLSPLQFATDRYGYDFGWFMVLYLTGGYLRRFGFGILKSTGRGLAVYLGSAALTAGTEVLLMILCENGLPLDYYRSVPFHYNYLLNLTGALGLFSAFWHMHIGEGKAAGMIRFVSPAVFGVYLIHGQADVANLWYGWISGLATSLAYPLRLLLHTSAVFWICIGIDKGRGLLFDRVGRFIAAKKSTRTA